MHPEAPSSKLARPSSESEAAATEPYFEAQEGVWCGLHALNNYLGGPYARRADCGLAAARTPPLEQKAAAADAEAKEKSWQLLRQTCFVPGSGSMSACPLKTTYGGQQK